MNIKFVSNNVINKMGVPSYFRDLLRKYPNIVESNIKFTCLNLYIDANCLFHPQCFKIVDLCIDIDDKKQMMRMMFDAIIKYINYIVNFAKPSNLIYIAVDGVAPVAKISQQRKRRFGGAYNYKHMVLRKHNIKFNDSWSNIVITPGTEFMFCLHNEIEKYCKTVKGINIIYSSYHEHGEGEHKILQHLKNNKDALSKNTKKSIVVYGLDADLIFLMMASELNNVYLLRESTDVIPNKQIKNEILQYVSIDKIKHAILTDKICGLGYIDNWPNKNELIHDYIFICYLLGNDFMPHLLSINIQINGMTHLIRAYNYVCAQLNCCLVNTSKQTEVSLNSLFLIEFLKILADQETYFFTNDLQNFMERANNKICNETEVHKKEIWRIENLQNVIHNNNTIKLGHGEYNEWKMRYYAHYFNTSAHMNEMINDICINYIEGLLWVANYYFNKCSSWRWQYKYTYAPLVSDIVRCIEKMPNIIDIAQSNIKSNDKPISMCSQLLSVVPSKFVEILPNELQHLLISERSPIIDMYPTFHKIDTLNETQLYKCHHILPYLNINRIEDAIEDAKFDDTQSEFMRKLQ